MTDVDDVLTSAAWRKGWEYDEFALTQEFLFDRDMRALNVANPDHAPHARSHVQDVVQLAAALLATGAAYERGGFVFFRGSDTAAGRRTNEPVTTHTLISAPTDTSNARTMRALVWPMAASASGIVATSRPFKLNSDEKVGSSLFV